MQDDDLVDVGFAVLQSAATNGTVLISSNGAASLYYWNY
jgi:hypothetical protein